MNWFSPQSPFFRGIGKIFEVIFVGILWFVTSFPIITIGASTTALYYVCTKVIRQSTGYIWREYFGCFTKNFRQATIPWIVQLGMIIILSFNIRLCQVTDKFWLKSLEISMWILLIILVCFVVYYFALLSHFHNTIGNLLKFAVFIPILNLPSTLIQILICFGVGIVFFLLPQLIILAPGVFGLVLSAKLEKIFEKYEKRTKNELEILK